MTIRAWCKSVGMAFIVAGVTLAVSSVNAEEKNTPPRNLVDLHARSGQLSNKQCLACHADVVKAQTLDRRIKTYHRLHLESKLPTPKNCSDCHQSVDLRNGSAASLRKQVSPDLCAGCHRGGVQGAKVLYAPQ